MAQSVRGPKGGGWDMGPGLVGLHLKGLFVGELFPIFQNWLTQGGTVSSESGRPQDAKALE